MPADSAARLPRYTNLVLHASENPEYTDMVVIGDGRQGAVLAPAPHPPARWVRFKSAWWTVPLFRSVGPVADAHNEVADFEELIREGRQFRLQFLDAVEAILHAPQCGSPDPAPKQPPARDIPYAEGLLSLSVAARLLTEARLQLRSCNERLIADLLPRQPASALDDLCRELAPQAAQAWSVETDFTKRCFIDVAANACRANDYGGGFLSRQSVLDAFRRIMEAYAALRTARPGQDLSRLLIGVPLSGPLEHNDLPTAVHKWENHLRHVDAVKSEITSDPDEARAMAIAVRSAGSAPLTDAVLREMGGLVDTVRTLPAAEFSKRLNLAVSDDKAAIREKALAFLVQKFTNVVASHDVVTREIAGSRRFNDDQRKLLQNFSNEHRLDAVHLRVIIDLSCEWREYMVHINNRLKNGEQASDTLRYRHSSLEDLREPLDKALRHGLEAIRAEARRLGVPFAIRESSASINNLAMGLAMAAPPPIHGGDWKALSSYLNLVVLLVARGASGAVAGSALS